jgi:hypothetical protein
MNAWEIVFWVPLLLVAYDLFHTRLPDTTSGGPWFSHNKTRRKTLVFGALLGAVAWAGWWYGNIEWMFNTAICLSALWLVYFGYVLRDFKAPHINVIGRRRSQSGQARDGSGQTFQAEARTS